MNGRGKGTATTLISGLVSSISLHSFLPLVTPYVGHAPFVAAPFRRSVGNRAASLVSSLTSVVLHFAPPLPSAPSSPSARCAAKEASMT